MSKTLVYLLGQYLIRIQDNSRWRSRFLAPWKNYEVQCDNSEHVNVDIVLSDGEISRDIDRLCGEWRYIHTQNGYVVSCIRDNTSIFCLAYERKKIEICLNSSLAKMKWFSIALQYAVMLGLSSSSIGLHGVTIICKDKVIVLSAPSGTGKTTLASLLNKYCETATINGDFALISLDDSNRVIFEPTPFCGSSAQCANHRLYIDQIVFLEQAKENNYVRLDMHTALSYVISNTFIPEWDEAKKFDIVSNAMKIVSSVPVAKFAFAPTEDAAREFFSVVTT